MSIKAEVGVYPTRTVLQPGYTQSMKTKFWTPQCIGCPHLLVNDKLETGCGYGKEEPRRLIHANFERNCHLRKV
jgi:hypothetical protein